MPDKHPFDLLNWQERLRKLSGQRVEDEWPDPLLNKVEHGLLRDASASAALWLTRIWAWATQALQRPSEASYERIVRASEQTPLNIDNTVVDIASVVRAGINRAKHQLELPQKGPWVEVPPKPAETIHVERQQLQKQAEWIARTSAATKMREWADGMREDVRWQVVQAIREGISVDELAERLKQKWDGYGAHFRTIAATEMGMAYNDGVLLQLAGDYVVIPAIDDGRVCQSCKKLLEGKVFYVSPTPIQDPTQQEYEQCLWPGKSNVGRLKENWWPCAPLHPNCRHVYVRYRGGDPYSYKAKPS